MTDQVGRKKSYRWASASQASYDGSGWDSSDEEPAIHAEHEAARDETVAELPALPNLDYSKEGEVKGDIELIKEEEHVVNSAELILNTTKNSPQLNVKRSPTNKSVNNDLDNLMVQISKEMTPVLQQTSSFQDDTRISDPEDEYDHIYDDFSASENDDHIPKEYFQKSVTLINHDVDAIDDDESVTYSLPKGNDNIASNDEDEFKVSKSGYFSKLIHPEENSYVEETSVKVLNTKSPREEKKETFFSDEDDGESSLIHGYSEEPVIENLVSRIPEVEDKKTEVIEPFVEELVTDEQVDGKSVAEEESIKSESKPDLSLVGEIDSSDDNANEVESDALSYTKSIKQSLNELSIKDSEEEDETLIRSNESEPDSIARDVRVSDEDEDKSRLEQNSTDTEYENKNDSEVNSDDDDNERSVDYRKSINYGDYKLDTDVFRSEFVQEPDNIVPEGFVVDEDGKLVDLTPAGMRSGAPSTYTRATESVWEAFPSGDSGDIATIGDTKTLYDNSTLMNVPGIITNNQSLPPLPEISSEVTTPTSNISKLSEKNLVPFLDMHKLLSSSNSHNSKLEQLQHYRLELESFDSGIQIWINHSLKSTTNSDANFVFQEYKVSKHVKHAYANADELSKKNTVINTVDTVTQNVSHLRKKVFSHSIKSTGLFASIGKKKL